MMTVLLCTNMSPKTRAGEKGGMFFFKYFDCRPEATTENPSSALSDEVE